MDKLGDQDVMYLAAYISLKRSTRRKKAEKARKKRTIYKTDLQAKRKIWHLSQSCARDGIRQSRILFQVSTNFTNFD